VTIRLALLSLCIACGSLVLGSATDPLPRVTAAAAGLRTDALSASTVVLQKAVDDHQVAGAVAMLAKGGRLAHATAVGYQDVAARVPMSEHSMFRIYSMTKPITAVAVMMLFEQGKFALDEPVSTYLPEFGTVTVADPDGTARRPSRPVSIRDLLLHTSGLDHRTSARYRDAQIRSRAITLPQFVRNIVRLPLMEDPGTRWRYSESTTVLGRLVEIWSGEPFDQFLQSHVFRPLGMSDTGFWVGPEQQQRLATVYSPGAHALEPIEIESVPFTERPALLEGAVGLVSTTGDYLRFAQMLLNRGQLDGARLLKPETVDTMVVNGLSDAVLAARGRGVMGWGLGNVNIVMKPEEVRYPAHRGEYGWDGTAGTIFWNDPARQTVVLLFTQSSPADPGNLRERFKAAIQAAID
jgi:CubicO group peptidase (beta-lactamase class C family)